MATVAVVYHSGRGHTAVLAEAVARGAGSVEGTAVHLLEIRHEQIKKGAWNDTAILAKLDGSDAIIFGCPTWMGSVSSVFKSFLERAFDIWLVQGWKDKIAAGFTNSASQSGDKLSTLFQLMVFAAQMGMIWVGVGDLAGNHSSTGSIADINRLGSWTGVMSQSNSDEGPDLAPPPSDRKTAERLGARVAAITHRWLGTGSYQTERARAI
jgi:NAD(P)H dehydrogenase (quinone)